MAFKVFSVLFCLKNPFNSFWYKRKLVALKTLVFLCYRQIAYPACYCYTHPFNGPFPGLPRWACTRKVKPIWILLKQETVSGSGISWAICNCTSLQTENHTSTPPLSFLQAGCPSCRPTNSVKALKALKKTYMSKINLQAETTNSGEQEEQREKTDMLRSIGKQSGESVESVQEKKW